MKKITSEINIENPKLRVKLGTMDKKTPQTIYIETGTYITPNSPENLNKDYLKHVENMLRKGVRNIISTHPLFSSEYIMDIDIAEDRLKVGKKTYFNLQCFLKQKSKNLLTLPNLQDKIEVFLTHFENTLTETGFTLSKTKK